MKQIGLLIYPVMGLLVFWMWTKVRHMNLSEIVDKSRNDHHHVNDILTEHPHGGTYREYQSWLQEESSH